MFKKIDSPKDAEKAVALLQSFEKLLALELKDSTVTVASTKKVMPTAFESGSKIDEKVKAAILYDIKEYNSFSDQIVICTMQKVSLIQISSLYLILISLMKY